MDGVTPEREAGSDAAIEALLARQPAGQPLLQEFYADPAIYRRDIERVLMRHWLCVDHESSMPEPGDYRLAEIAGEPIILVRGKDRELRALANVCRHRGSRVCAEERGKAEFFVCPYHAWTYGLDGRLAAARHMPPGFDLASHGLRRIALRVVEGLVLVSFAETPPALTHVETALRQGYGPYGWRDARVAHRESYDIAANWKLAVENYLECYHCAPAHPEYARLHALEQPLPRIQHLAEAAEARTRALGVTVEPLDRWLCEPGEESVNCFRYPLHEGVVSGTDDGGPAAPPMGDFTGYDGGVTALHLGPACFFLAYPDHGVIYRFLPLAPQRCAMEVIWLVRGDAREGVDYDLDRLTWLWKVTSVADKRIIEENQRGVNSRFYTPGPYAPMEHNTKRYIGWYLAQLA